MPCNLDVSLHIVVLSLQMKALHAEVERQKRKKHGWDLVGDALVKVALPFAGQLLLGGRGGILRGRIPLRF